MDKRDVMVDLKLNRRESGLSGSDLAHLLATSKARISKLHTGNAVMTIDELFALSLVYGKTIDHLFEHAINSLANELKNRLSEMPDEPDNWKGHDQRLDCLNALTGRLLALTKQPHENS